MGGRPRQHAYACQHSLRGSELHNRSGLGNISPGSMYGGLIMANLPPSSTHTYLGTVHRYVAAIVTTMPPHSLKMVFPASWHKVSLDYISRGFRPMLVDTGGRGSRLHLLKAQLSTQVSPA